MHSEGIYRALLLIIFLLSIMTAGYHRLRATAAGGRISRDEEGTGLFWSIRLAGLALLISNLLFLIQPTWIAWSSISLPPTMRWGGFALGIVAVALTFWTLRTLGNNLTDTVSTRAEHTLVQDGPYRWVRHPYYVALLLLVTSTSLIAANWLLAASGLAVFTLLAWRIPLEEKYLVERFGDAYRDYQRTTAGLIPRPRAVRARSPSDDAE